MAMHKIIFVYAVSCAIGSSSVAAAEVKAAPEPKEACKLGKSQYASGDVVKAIKTLGKCVEREARNREAWVALAYANLEAGRFPQSVDAFARAEALKPGDDAFLSGYLSALEGAGKTEEQIPVLRQLVGKQAKDRKPAERLLASVEAAGADKYPAEYLFALQSLSESPPADRNLLEKLAAAYLKRGSPEKAEAEYRGLLVKYPESSEDWAGLGASLAASDAQAAGECYRKAAFYSDNAGQRVVYQDEQKRFAKAASASQNNTKATFEDSRETAVLAATAPAPTVAAPVAPAPKPPAVASAPAKQAAQPIPTQPQAVPTAKVKPFDVKAYQDSIYKVELDRRLAVLHVPKTAASSAPVPTLPASTVIPSAAAPSASASSSSTPSASPAVSVQTQSEKDQQVRAMETKAAAEKARQIQSARLAQEADNKAKEEKRKQDELARKQADADKQRLALAEKARQDSVSRENDKRAKAEKEKQELLAKADKARQDSISRENDKRAKAEKEKQELLAKEAAKARKLKEEQDRRDQLARERSNRYDRALACYREARTDSAAILFKAVLADSPRTDAYYFAGRTFLAKGDYSQALEAFGKASSDKADLDGLKGKALLGLGKNKEALAALEAQYAKGAGDSLLPDLVNLKRKAGDEPGAIAYLERLAEKRPAESKYQEELAAYYRGKGDRAKASLHYSKVFIMNTSHVEANYWLGMEAAKAGDHAQAVPMLERVVVANPARADVWKAIAMGDAALGRKDPAWEAYRKASALLPADLDLARGKLALARESHPAEAGQAYEDVLRIAPQDAEAALGLAKLRFQEGNYPVAEKNYRIACKDSKDPHVWAEFGRSLLEQKKNDEAAAILQKAVDMGEKDPALRMDLARIRMDKGDLDWAEALFKDLGKKSPADPEPLYWQGQIALKRQQTAVGEEFFRKAHQLKPEDGRYAEALARQLRDKEDWKAAIAALSQAEGKLTLSGRLLYGDCLAHAGDASKAQEIYSQLYRQEASAALLSRRVDLLVRMGKAEQASDLVSASPYQDATEVRYSLAKAQLSLADAHVIKGDVDQAVAMMKQVVKSDDHRPDYHYYLGLAYFDQNRYKKALGEFADAITYRVDYPEALYHKGLCLLQTEDIKEAENAFGELSQHADAVWKARGLYGLAMVFEAQGKTEAVAHHLERSVASFPLPEAMAYLSRVSLRGNKVAEAQDWARKALNADPSNEIATVALAEALSSGKRQTEAMQLAEQGLKARPLSCGLMVQTAKLNLEAGNIDSSLAMSNHAIRICPDEKMAYYYAGAATHGSNRPKEAKQYFKSFRKLGGDKKLVPED